MRIRLLVSLFVCLSLLASCSGSSTGDATSGDQQKKESTVTAEEKVDSEVTVTLAASSEELKQAREDLENATDLTLALTEHVEGLQSLYLSLQECRLTLMVFAQALLGSDGSDTAFSLTNTVCNGHNEAEQ